MKTCKRVISLLLLLSLTVTLFSGCAGKSVTKSEETAKTATAAAAPVVIDWVPQNDAPTNPDAPILKEVAKKFNVKINMIYFDRNKAAELLNLRIASGEVPDVMKLDKNTFANYASQGALAELPEDKLKKFAPVLVDVTKKNGGEFVFEDAKVKGKLYGIPFLNQNNASTDPPIWRDDWLKNVSINKIPETLQEAEDAFYKFANNDPDKNGKKDTYALSSTGFNVILGAFGGIAYNLGVFWQNVDGKLVASAALPEMKDGLKLLNKWYKDGLIDPEFISGENKGQNKFFSVIFWNGRIGFACPGYYYRVSPPLRKDDDGSDNYVNFKKLQPNGTYTYGKPLVGPSGKSGSLRRQIVDGTTIAFGVNTAKNPEKMERALQIMEAAASDYDFYMLVVNGRKDIDYTLNADGSTTPIGEAANKDYKDKNAFSSNGVNILASNFEFKTRGNQADAEFKKKYADGPYYQNKVTMSLPSDGKYKADLEKRMLEFYTLAITGAKSVDEFDSFVSTLNKAGLEQLTKEANEWFAPRKSAK